MPPPPAPRSGGQPAILAIATTDQTAPLRRSLESAPRQRTQDRISIGRQVQSVRWLSPPRAPSTAVEHDSRRTPSPPEVLEIFPRPPPDYCQDPAPGALALRTCFRAVQYGSLGSIPLRESTSMDPLPAPPAPAGL